MNAIGVSGFRHYTPRAFALAGCLSSALLLLALTGCGLSDVRVTIANESGQPLDSLVVVGEELQKRVRPLAPGEVAEVRVGVKGEDALALRGRIGGRPLVPQMAAYVEAGHALRLVVDRGGVVQVESSVDY